MKANRRRSELLVLLYAFSVFLILCYVIESVTWVFIISVLVTVIRISIYNADGSRIPGFPVSNLLVNIALIIAAVFIEGHDIVRLTAIISLLGFLIILIIESK